MLLVWAALFGLSFVIKSPVLTLFSGLAFLWCLFIPKGWRAPMAGAALAGFLFGMFGWGWWGDGEDDDYHGG